MTDIKGWLHGKNLSTYFALCNEKFAILQSIGIIVIKSRETTAVIYTCRYSSGQLYLLVYNFGNNYNIGELTSTTSKERMTTNIIFMGVTTIN